MDRATGFEPVGRGFESLRAHQPLPAFLSFSNGLPLRRLPIGPREPHSLIDIERHERVVHRNELLREVWGYLDMSDTRSVDHAIARLRKKIEPGAHRPRFTHTVHGDGYCLTPERSPGAFPNHP
jgi:hypothetical protein